MTHNALVSFYPRITYVDCQNYFIHGPWCPRHWQLSIPLSMLHPEAAHTSLEYEDYRLLRVHEGKNPVRTLGDSDCWTMVYDEDGNNTDSHSTVANTKEKNDLEGNKWYIRVNTGKIAMEVEAARLTDFDPYL